jgi:hypothetical protein
MNIVQAATGMFLEYAGKIVHLGMLIMDSLVSSISSHGSLNTVTFQEA